MPTEGKSRRVRRRKELHVSNRLYDLLLLTTYQSRHPVRTIGPIDLDELNKELPEVSKKVQEWMKERCTKTPDFYDVPKDEDDGEIRGCRIDVESDLRKWKGEEPREYWKFPHKNMRCPEKMLSWLEGKELARGVTFGQFDLAILHPSPHEYWSCCHRALLSALKDGGMINEVVSIPMLRVKHSRGYEDEERKEEEERKKGVEDLMEVAFERPFVVLTFVRFPSFLQNRCSVVDDTKKPDSCNKDPLCLRSRHLRYFADHILGLDISDEPRVEPFRDPGEGNRLELFITLCGSFPALIKAEFDKFDQIHDYLRKLRQRVDLVEDTCSIIAVNSTHLAPSGDDSEQDAPFTSDDLITFGLLCNLVSQVYDQKQKRMKVKSYTEVAREIRSMLLEELILPEIREEILGSREEKRRSPGFDEKEKKKEEEEVRRRIKFYSRAYDWDLFLRIETRNVIKLMDLIMTKVRANDHVYQAATIPYWDGDQYREHSQTSSSGKFDINKHLEELNEHLERCKVLRESIRPRPQQDDEDEKDEDKKLEHLINSDLDLPGYRHPKAPEVMSRAADALNNVLYNLKFDFEWLLGYVILLEKAWCANLSPEVISFKLLRSMVKECRDDCLKETRRLNKHREYIKKADNSAVRNRLLAEVWNLIERVRKKKYTIKEIVSSLAGEYDSMLEGRQITSIAETDPRFGEKAGVIDLAMDAADRLMREYCGIRKNGNGPRQTEDHPWQGLVSTSAVADFKIYPRFQLLKLPMDFKFHVHGKLLMLAHEAAHQILYWEVQKSEMTDKGKTDKVKTVMVDPEVPLSPKKTFHEIWCAAHDRAIEFAKKLDSDRAIIEELEKRKDKQIFQESEIFVDILAGIIAGPAYFVAFSQSSSLSPTSKPMRYYPPDWIRLLLIRKVMTVLQWADDTWDLDGKFEQFFCHEEALVFAYTPIYKNGQPRKLVELLRRYFEEDPADAPEAMIKMIIGPGNRYLDDPKFFLAKALMSDKGKLLMQLYNWAEEHYDNLTFIPKKYSKKPEIRYRVTEYCQVLAERLALNDELVLDAPLKYIAAASVLSPVSRPAYPVGRILLSLSYSSGDRNNFEEFIKKKAPQ